MGVRGAVWGERGQVTPLLAVLAVATGGLCLLLARLGGEAVDAARATTAADAAALAGAAEGEAAARAAAAANGGAVVAYEDDGSDVEVSVTVGAGTARARATGARRGAGAGGATRAGLAPEVTAALARAEAVLGEAVPISSGWRSPAQQAALWAGRLANPYPVAPPGRSAHERGEAVDVPAAFAERLAAIGPAVGLCRPLPRTDPIHFELCGR